MENKPLTPAQELSQNFVNLQKYIDDVVQDIDNPFESLMCDYLCHP